MTLSNEQIVASLIAFYRRNGVDLTYLLGDPTFQSLKVHEKVEAIKAHAAEIYNNSSDNLTKAEKARIGFEAGATAMVTAPALFGLHTAGMFDKLAPTLNRGLHNRSLASAAVMGVGGGLLAGALKGAFSTLSAQRDRQALRRELRNAAVNPGTDSAVGVLATNNIQRHVHPLRELLVDRAHQMLDRFNPEDAVHNSYLNHYNSGATFRNIPTVPDNFGRQL